jgi:hypothetical protein
MPNPDDFSAKRVVGTRIEAIPTKMTDNATSESRYYLFE